MNIELNTKKLYDSIIKEGKKALNDSQKEKLNYACEKAIKENPNLSYNDWKMAANLYLNYILNFPQINFGPIKDKFQIDEE